MPRDSASRYWKYLNEVLTYLGYTLTLRRLEDPKDELLDGIEHAKVRHMVKALSKFIKVVLMKRSHSPKYTVPLWHQGSLGWKQRTPCYSGLYLDTVGCILGFAI